MRGPVKLSLAMFVFFVGGVIMGGEILTAGAARHKIVSAHEFRILDSAGKPRAALLVDPSGNLSIKLLKKDGGTSEKVTITPKTIADSRKAARTLKKMEKGLMKFETMWHRFWPASDKKNKNPSQ